MWVDGKWYMRSRCDNNVTIGRGCVSSRKEVGGVVLITGGGIRDQPVGTPLMLEIPNGLVGSLFGCLAVFIAFDI
jgi:hypothetical protein